jgi:hypothetical protein
MADAYRQMPEVLAGEREEAAVRDFGRWRDRVRTLILLAFALVGVVLGAIAYEIVQDFQFDKWNRASLYMNVGAAAVPFIGMLVIGRFVGRHVARKRAPAKIAELAKGYEISEDVLLSTAQMVEKL